MSPDGINRIRAKWYAMQGEKLQIVAIDEHLKGGHPKKRAQRQQRSQAVEINTDVYLNDKIYLKLVRVHPNKTLALLYGVNTIYLNSVFCISSSG